MASLFAPKPGAAVWAWIVGGLLVAVVILALLDRLPSRSKRRLIVTTTFLAGLYYALEFLLPEKASWYPHFGHSGPLSPPISMGGLNPLSPYIEIVGQVVQVVLAFTLGLGAYNLIYFHTRNIRRVRPDWPFSVLFFASFFTMLVIGFWHDLPTYRHGATVPEWVNGTWKALFNGLLVSLDSTMFSLLAFYIVSAAYRAFRIRSGEALLLMLAAVVVMLTPLPLGMAITSWIPPDSPWAIFRIERMGEWLLMTINSAALRAIGFGLGIGGLAMSLRVWLSLERGTYFGQEV